MSKKAAKALNDLAEWIEEWAGWTDENRPTPEVKSVLETVAGEARDRAEWEEKTT